jgi:hypothetical protein
VLHLGWDALGAIGSFGQFVVVVAAAFFGAAQLRHLRRQNELNATLPYFAYQRTDAYLRAALIVRTATEGGDPALRAVIASEDITDPRFVELLRLGMFLNEMALLIESGVIDGDVLLPNFGWQIMTTFDLMRPWVAARRRTLPATWVPLEALAVRARAIRPQDRLITVRKQLPPRLRDAFDRSVEQTRASASLERSEAPP